MASRRGGAGKPGRRDAPDRSRAAGGAPAARDSETAESQAAGIGRWQTRVESPSHRKAVALARKLEGEGLPVVRRWKFLIVSADNEDDVRKLAGQIRPEAPPDAVARLRNPELGWVFMPS